jgi:hypothetical protein
MGFVTSNDASWNTKEMAVGAGAGKVLVLGEGVRSWTTAR